MTREEYDLIQQLEMRVSGMNARAQHLKDDVQAALGALRELLKLPWRERDDEKVTQEHAETVTDPALGVTFRKMTLEEVDDDQRRSRDLSPGNPRAG